MKLECMIKKDSKGFLEPRDVRNICRDLVQENFPDDKGLLAFVNHHKHETSPVIYSKPSHKSFSIITYMDETVDAFEYKFYMTMIANLLNGKTFTVRNITFTVKETQITNFDYTSFEENDGYEFREIRVPLVIGSSNTEYAIAIEATKNQNGRSLTKESKKIIEELAVNAIKSSIIAQNRDWFGEDKTRETELSKIRISNLVYMPIKYKDKQYFPAIKGTIRSNTALPKFLGYKIGFGYGEVSNKGKSNA